MLQTTRTQLNENNILCQYYLSVQWPRVLRRTFACSDSVLESRRWRVCLFVVSVVCCR